MAEFTAYEPVTDTNFFVTHAAQSVERMVEKVSRAEKALSRKLLDLRQAEGHAQARLAELAATEQRVSHLTALLGQHAAQLDEQSRMLHEHIGRLDEQSVRIDRRTHAIEQTGEATQASLRAMIPQLTGDLKASVDSIELMLGERVENRMNAVAAAVEAKMSRRMDDIAAAVERRGQAFEDRINTLDSHVDEIVRHIRQRVTDDVIGQVTRGVSTLQAQLDTLNGYFESIRTRLVNDAIAGVKRHAEALENRLTTLDANAAEIVADLKQRVADDLRRACDDLIRDAVDKAHKEAESFARPLQQQLAQVRSEGEFVASRIQEQIRLSLDSYRARAAEIMRTSADVRYTISPEPGHREAA